jgi:hypothetical protein
MAEDLCKQPKKVQADSQAIDRSSSPLPPTDRRAPALRKEEGIWPEALYRSNPGVGEFERWLPTYDPSLLFQMANGEPACGSDLHLMECLRLRAKDIDFGYAKLWC